MRCDNCGWSNPEGLTKCQKCNQELLPPVSNAINQTVLDPNRQSAASQQSPSVSCPRCGYPLSSANSFCPNCGTQIQHDTPAEQPVYAKTVRVLPDEFLDEPAEQKPVEAPLKATVREIPVKLMDNNYSKTVRVLPEEMLVNEEPAEPSFRLVPMDNFDGATAAVKEFNGAVATVAGDSLVENGGYMPDGLEVEFTCEDGQWSVTDKGASKAVFVSASHPVKIQSGDIIVIGNRRFIFE